VHVPLTIFTLALFTAAIVLLRLRWQRLSRNWKQRLIRFGIASIGTLLLTVLARVSTTSDQVNVLVYWCCILSYIFFVVLFTLIRPYWLTSLIAVILLVPLLSSSAILPLGAIFAHQQHHETALGAGLTSDLVTIDPLAPAATGADLSIYRRPAWAPFLQRKLFGARYFDTECHASAAIATLQPDRRGVLMICPAAPDRPPADRRSYLLPLSRH
jgi:hypothetical protein